MAGFAVMLAVLILMIALPADRAAAAQLAALSLLDAKVSYVADFYVLSDKGRFDGAMIHAPGRERRSFDAAGGREVLLLRRDTDQAAILWPERKWYLSTSFSALGALVGGLENLRVETMAAGHERLSGEAVTRYRAKAEGPKGAAFDGMVWVTADGIVMKMTGRAVFAGRDLPFETGLAHLRRMPADPQAFVLPSDYSGIPLDISRFGIR